MPFRQFTLVVSGPPAQRLSNAYGDGVGIIIPDHDIPYRELLLLADPSNASAIYIGDSDLTAPDNAAFALLPGIGNMPFFRFGPYGADGPIRLSDFWTVSVTGTPRLLLSGVPF